MDKLDNVRFVVADIDGTIVNEERVLTPRTRQVLNQLHHEGILVGIASGRPLDEVYATTINWDLDFPVDCIIGMNGGEFFDTKRGKRFDYFKLKQEWIKEIIDHMKPFSTNPFIYTMGGIMCLRRDDMMQRSSKHSRKPIYIANDVSDMYKEENCKIMFRIPEDVMPIVEAYFEDLNSEHYKAFKTQATLIEFAHRDISKAFAVNKFCDIYDVDMKDVAAFGDTSNDNDMLVACGYGVCLLNGSDDTKALADYITELTNDEDGFADFIERTIL